MSLLQCIEHFNQAIASVEFYEHYRVQSGKPALALEIAELEAQFKLQMPAELKQFYQELGSVNTVLADESNHISIHSAGHMLKALNHKEHWYKLYSPGLIDYVRYGWTHDRWELDEFISKRSQEILNAKYQVIGIWRENDILEGAHYFYFDASGKFGTVYYHQDSFDDFMGALKPMLESSPANQTLAQCIEGALLQIKVSLLSD